MSNSDQDTNRQRSALRVLKERGRGLSITYGYYIMQCTDKIRTMKIVPRYDFIRVTDTWHKLLEYAIERVPSITEKTLKFWSM